MQYGFPASDWMDAMAWLRRTPLGTHVLADPAHAWRYGTSVRVAAGRDVFFEEVKDTAMAMYSRRVAMRAIERIGAVGDFSALTPSAARVLASRFDLDYLVTAARPGPAHRLPQRHLPRLHTALIAADRPSTAPRASTGGGYGTPSCSR